MRSWLALLRPANIVTALGDTLAGLALAGGWALAMTDTELLIHPALPWLLLSSASLYGGGVVLNDRADADLDTIERPERPIPSGAVSRTAATALTVFLFALALLSASRAGTHSLFVATGTLVFILLYNLRAKHQPFVGPLVMGLCRSGNLLLGGSLFLHSISRFWPFLLIPLIYIAAITWISRHEVDGKTSGSGIWAIASVTGIVMALLIAGWAQYDRPLDLLLLLLTLTLFVIGTLPPFFQAVRSPEPDTIQRAVKSGVLSLTSLNAAIAAMAGAPWIVLITLSLLPLSLWIASRFRVT